MALEGAQRAVLRLLRVPPEPDPPAGAPGSVRIFRAAKNFFYYSLVKWVLKQFSTLIGIVVGLYFLAQGWMDQIQFGFFAGEDWFWILEAIGIGTFVLQIPLTLAGVLLDFRMRWYIVTDRSLRIREGVGRVREKTMSFSNIQNLSVRQGPLQRLLGISDLEVKSAGGGQGNEEAEKEGDNLHTGYFRGVDNAEEIKAVILQRLRRLRDSGLGDPEEDRLAAAAGEAGAVFAAEPEPFAVAAPASAPAAVPRAAAGASSPAARELLAAAGELLEETRRLRASV